jgi:outer membrane protein assembly factor BamB
VPAISPRPVLDDYIVEVDPSGTTVREWYTSDHFDELGFSGIAKLLISMSGGDWSHTNSIHTLPENSTGDPRFKPGNILVSQRSTNIVFIIDKDTGAIVWKYGPGNSLLVGQHDAKMIEEGYSGAGNILLFDNGGRAGYPTKTRGFSRVLEVDPLSMQIVWQYTAAYSGLDPRRFYSGTISSAQRLPNGNTFIDEGETGRLFEVAPDGEIVWEYINPFFWPVGPGVMTNNVYRAWRVPPDWPTFR